MVVCCCDVYYPRDEVRANADDEGAAQARIEEPLRVEPDKAKEGRGT